VPLIIQLNGSLRASFLLSVHARTWSLKSAGPRLPATSWRPPRIIGSTASVRNVPVDRSRQVEGLLPFIMPVKFSPQWPSLEMPRSRLRGQNEREVTTLCSRPTHVPPETVISRYGLVDTQRTRAARVPLELAAPN
jgi:hypothetical protein